jgi:hypothetical protein
MAVVTKTAPTFTQIFAPAIVTNQNLGTRSTLDLTTKVGATLLVFIGRRANTTPTRAGYVAIRRTDNSTVVVPSTVFDVVNQGPTTAGAATTLTAQSNSGTNTVTVTANTGFAVGDVVCFSESTGARIQWNRIALIGGTSNLTFTLEFPLHINANNGDTISNLADVRQVYLPGGDVYEIRPVNYSGLDEVFCIEAIIDNGETIT